MRIPNACIRHQWEIHRPHNTKYELTDNEYYDLIAKYKGRAYLASCKGHVIDSGKTEGVDIRVRHQLG